MKRAHIISIGNELLIGDTVNTNASWLGRFLTEKGFRVDEVLTISDDYSLIKGSVKWSLEHADFVIVTGGLGPTHDDVTKKAVADLFGCKLILNKDVLQHIKRMFSRRGFTFSKSNRDQALVPEVCEVLFNNKGTAPGMWFQGKNSYLTVLPGVPYEMKYLMEKRVSKKIKKVFPSTEYRTVSYLKTAGVPESSLSDDVIGNLNDFIENDFEIAYLPGPGGVTIRISCSSDSIQSSENKIKELESFIKNKAGNFIYGRGRDISLAEVVGDELKKRELTIAVAESCTGGHLSNEITNIPGCSEYMNGGIVAYSNDVKINQLNVSAEVIEKYGAVSKMTALSMAEGIAKKLTSDIGVSTTGIAGPGGGTATKPVGTVWMGFWMKGNHFALKALLTKDRFLNKERTTMIVLETIRRSLLNIDSVPYDLKKETA
ncbi:MAG: competence/damage-inducible protein A [Balneolaceae bacterium]